MKVTLRPQLVRAALKLGALTFGVMWMFFTLMSEGAQAPRGRLGGDFPAFYGAGKLVLQGREEALYDPDSLLVVQKPYLLPDEQQSYLKFAYPPFVAVAYAPMAIFPYRTAYALHTLFLALLLALAVQGRVVAGQARWQPRWPLVLCTLVVFLPLSEALRGSQNTPLTLALAFATYCFGERKYLLLAGACCAALAFKPQFFLPFFLLFAFRYRSLSFATGAGALLGLLYLIGAYCLGWLWPARWLNQAMRFRREDFNQGDRLISLLEQLEVYGVLTLHTSVSLAFFLLGSILAVWLFYKTNSWLGFVCGVLLSVPHCVYYDAGLLALGWPGMLAGPSIEERNREYWSLALVVVGAAIVLWGTLGTILCLAGLVWSWRQRDT